MGLYSKILEAQKAIGWVQKNGKVSGTGIKYDYTTEADTVAGVKQAYLDAGLVVITSSTSEIGTYHIDNGVTRDTGYPIPATVMRWAKVTLNYKVIDPDTSEKEEGTFDGYAEDRGDKAIYKATTGANKYFLLKFFGVATGDDPEKQEQPGYPPTLVQSLPAVNLPLCDKPPSAPTKITHKIDSAANVADHLNALREKLGLSESQLSEVCGIGSVPALIQMGKIEKLDAAMIKLESFAAEKLKKQG